MAAPIKVAVAEEVVEVLPQVAQVVVVFLH
jgi:hypothetical protein